MLKMRVEGLPEEIKTFLEKFKQSHNILSESKQYPNRNSDYVRVYIEFQDNERGEK